ncbi:TfpX/TfpZ family type IV pilin accessory protein [Variovorax paradoxus]|uniref:TfpX/TfpZ family type IV pilin accessory protein n=1 Tax=Variovorax paradoxus TaxID=34073 RepID=UPI003ED043FE
MNAINSDVAVIKVKNRLKSGLKALSLHFLASVAVVGCASVVVFRVWHPYPYWNLTGGAYLFFVLASVDVVCGPVLTGILYSPKKSKKELVLDLSVVATIQVAALCYGLYTVAQARPVVIVFEVDRLVAIAAADIDPSELSKAPPKFQRLSWTGPRLLGIREPRDSNEMLRALEASLKGVEPSSRPDWWRELSPDRSELRSRMRSISLLLRERPDGARKLLQEIADANQASLKDLYFLPLTGKKSRDWIVVLNQRAEFLGFAPIDGFLMVPKK